MIILWLSTFIWHEMAGDPSAWYAFPYFLSCFALGSIEVVSYFVMFINRIDTSPRSRIRR